VVGHWLLVVVVVMLRLLAGGVLVASLQMAALEGREVEAVRESLSVAGCSTETVYAQPWVPALPSAGLAPWVCVTPSEQGW
jgi:hypothetical protein